MSVLQPRRLAAARRRRGRRGARLPSRDAHARVHRARHGSGGGARAKRERRFGDLGADAHDASHARKGKEPSDAADAVPRRAAAGRRASRGASCRRIPGFTAVAVLTLALGIGGTTAIFSAVYAVVLQPLPLRDPARLMLVGEIYEGAPSGDVGRQLRRRGRRASRTSNGLSALQLRQLQPLRRTTPERVVGARVTANYFDVMGVRPLLGRTFTADEDQPGNDRVVVLSHRLWTRRFGADAAIGRQHDPHERRQPTRSLGVMPAVVRPDHRQRRAVDADRVHAGAAGDCTTSTTSPSTGG